MISDVRAVILEDVTRSGRDTTLYRWGSGRLLSEDKSGMKKPNALKKLAIPTPESREFYQREVGVNNQLDVSEDETEANVVTARPCCCHQLPKRQLKKGNSLGCIVFSKYKENVSQGWLDKEIYSLAY